MTPNRTAPPVARRLTERAAAPPLPPALVGVEATEDRLVLELTRLVADDAREVEETPEATLEETMEEMAEELTEETPVVTSVALKEGERAGRKIKSA